MNSPCTMNIFYFKKRKKEVQASGEIDTVDRK
jgi:hypothetical protein